MTRITLALLLLTMPVHAGELPCPPKRYFCWEVKAAVNLFGEQALVEKARSCGWPESRIAIARRCLAK